MGKPAARKGDKCSGHGSALPRPNDQGSPNVFINGKPAHRKGDHWMQHSGHDSRLATGSPVVFVNGKPQGRVGDTMIACASRVAQGSPDVFVGDSGTSGPATIGSGVGSATVDYNDPYRFNGQYSGSGTVESEGGVDGAAPGSAAKEFPDSGPLDASDADIDWLTTCMIDEAGGESTADAWAAVAQVIANRLSSGQSTGTVNSAWHGTLKGIILANGQFSGFWFDFIGGRYTRVISSNDWSGVETRGKQKMARYRQRSQWATFKAVGQQVIASSYGGGPAWRLVKSRRSLMYCNTDISHPAWATPARYISKVEHHTFFT